MLVGCAVYIKQILNNFLCENRLSDSLSTATLISGTSPPSYKEKTKLKFRDYIEIPYEETRNDNTTRTIGGIALYSSNNSSGGWYFISLIIGYPVHKIIWTIRPASDLILLNVKKIAQRQNQNLIGKISKYLSRRMLESIKNNDSDSNINAETENTDHEDYDDELNGDI